MEQVTASLVLGIKSRYKFISVHPETGKETPLSGWSENTLLDAGRNQMADQNWFTYCQVGTSSITPDAGQDSLQGYVNGTSNVEETITGAEATSPFFGWKRKRFRFPVGDAAGILNEVGIGWGASGATLVTRALTEDINGVQASIVVVSDEYLDVIVEVRYYPPLVDATGTVELNGVTYDYTMRASQVTSTPLWADTIGDAISSYAVANSDWSFYDLGIVDIDAVPAGTPYASDNANDYTSPYSSGSYQIVFGMNVGPNGWNATTNELARTLVIKTTAGQYQIEFDSQVSPGSGIPKTTLLTMQMQFILGWQEEAIP